MQVFKKLTKKLFKKSFPKTDDDVTLVSKNYPDMSLGMKIGESTGSLTSENAPSHHFKIVEGICKVGGTVSFKSVQKPGYFLRVSMRNKRVYLEKWRNQEEYLAQACFYPKYDKYFQVRFLLACTR